jgi:hypothetical protein
MLLVALDFRIFQLATNQTLSVKDSVFRVGVEGILSGVTDTTKVNPQLEMELEDLMSKTHSRSSSEKETHEGVIRWP